MINNVVLVGRLTREIELKKTSSNTSYCRFTLACDRKYSSANNNNNNQPTADFISCVAWRQSADFLAQYARKGAIVAVEGRITTGSYDGQNGKVYTTDVTCESVRLIGGNKDNASANNNNTQANQNKTFTPSVEPTYSENQTDDDFSNTPSLDISSDDLPFY